MTDPSSPARGPVPLGRRWLLLALLVASAAMALFVSPGFVVLVLALSAVEAVLFYRDVLRPRLRRRA